MSTELVFRCLACDQPRSEADVPCELCGSAPDLHVVEGDELVTYDPFRLNALIDEVTERALRERLDVVADTTTRRGNSRALSPRSAAQLRASQDYCYAYGFLASGR